MRKSVTRSFLKQCLAHDKGQLLLLWRQHCGAVAPVPDAQLTPNEDLARGSFSAPAALRASTCLTTDTGRRPLGFQLGSRHWNYYFLPLFFLNEINKLV